MESLNYAHHFSIDNIPFGIASSEKHLNPQAVSRFENTVIFLHDLEKDGFYETVGAVPPGIFARPTLNDFAALGKDLTQGVRRAIHDALKSAGLLAFPSRSLEETTKVTMHLPIEVRDFTDFSVSLYHNLNMSRISMGTSQPPPCFFHYPAGYGGRAGSVVVSGTPIERPYGKYYDPEVQAPPGHPRPVVFGASKQMDYEVEFGAIIGKPLPMRQRLNAKDADQHIFGFVIINDWSVRDIQALEMRPMGPLNSKNVGTSMSPWVITPDALEPFVTRSPPRQVPVVSYLDDPDEKTYSVAMNVTLTPKGCSQTTLLGQSNIGSLYWSVRQMIAHIASAGSPLRTGDLMATGTISGSEPSMACCLSESTDGGRRHLSLEGGGTRIYLEDGDFIRMTAVAGSEASGVGFGECVGELLPARPFERTSSYQGSQQGG